ncbi:MULTISPECIES: hypothetical protein [unclassified Bradyrhizobium]|uniref:hypothetical protein n=1 Tax=unclassified Bradyrhizobium TaxID=2631580 RepID=UPI0028E61172|nr:MULTISPECIES: hypothetical protein [unclassified Bradyrhizobium]
MTKEDFYRKLTGALLGQAFQFEANGLSRDEVTKDRDVLTSFTRKATQFVPPVLGKIHTVFDEHVVQQSLDKLRQAAPIVCFKYVLSQPVLVAVVEADGIADEKAIEFACLFDSVVLEMLNVTGKMGGIKVGGLHLGGTKLSATGITLHVFFDQASASTFAEHTQQKCKIRHFWRKTWILPWLVDVPGGAVSSHRGLPFLPSVLAKENLQKALFL